MKHIFALNNEERCMFIFDFKKPQNALSLVVLGFYFGIVQTAFYFSIEVFVTATFTGYFFLVLAWMCGVVFAMKTDLLENIYLSISSSIALFYIFLLFVIFIPFNGLMFPFLGLLIFISSFPAGKFVKLFGKSVSSDSLFFHENNGFVLGMVMAVLLFVKFGIHFIYFAPILAYLLTILSLKKRDYEIFGIVLVILPIFAAQHYWIGVCALSVLLFVLLIAKMIEPKFASLPSTDTEIEGVNISYNQLKIIIFIAGFNLILLQYLIVREYANIISANELSILFVGAAYFIGFSVGYILSNKISFSVLKLIGFVTFILHMIVFASIKFIASYLVVKGFSYEALLLLLFISSFLTSSFYSIFLPKIIQLKGAGELPTFYSIELIGAAIGIIFFILVVIFSQWLLLPVYFLLFLILYFILYSQDKWRYPLLLTGIYLIGIFLIHQTEIGAAGTKDYYQAQGYSNPKLLFSKNSFYHSVDVLETYYDKFQTIKQSKISFLNGQKYFDYNYPFPGIQNDETSLSEFTYFLANLPAHYKFQRDGKKQRVLILGGGSLYSINRVAQYSSKTTVVEIDPAVIESSKQCWSEINKYNQLKNYEIIIDDAKKYLKASDEKFDLIIMDISAPYYLGSALLHNKEFFELIKSKLKPGGIFSESTQGRPNPLFPSGTPLKILKAIHEVFPNYFVIDCKSYPRGKRGFVMASEKIPISFNQVVNLLMQDGKLAGASLYGNKDQKINLSDVKPFSLYSMENLWEGNISRIKNRLSYEKNRDKIITYNFPTYLQQEFLNIRFITLTVMVILFAFALRYLPENHSSDGKKK